jgi:hypothetical protein
LAILPEAKANGKLEGLRRAWKKREFASARRIGVFAAASRTIDVSLKRNVEITRIFTYIFSGLSFLMSVLFLIRSPKPPQGFIVAFFKLTAGALSPYWAIMGLLGVVIGWVYQPFWAVPMGMLGAGMMIRYVWRCTRDHKGYETAFGASWSNQIMPEQPKLMVQKR